jgi:Tfp pilus assembly protein PilV
MNVTDNKPLSACGRSGLSGPHRAFTLMEVMIAVMILFMCLFAVMALLTNSLRSARMLQQHRGLDAATINGLVYVQLSNTNQVSEGEQRIELDDELFPDYRFNPQPMVTEIGTNGLAQIDLVVQRRSDNETELKTSFLMFLPTLRRGGLGGGLRR